MAYRYLAQRIGTNEWLHYDLPITTDGPWESCSTYETFTGTVEAGVAQTIADDGVRLLHPWGTWIHVETDDGRENTLIVEDISGSGSTLTVTAREWHGYLDGLVWTGRIWAENKDPADVVRELWRHSLANTDMGASVTVAGSTPVRLGSTSESVMLSRKAARDVAKRTHENAAKPRKALEAEIKRLSAPHDKAIKAMEKARRAPQRAHALLVRQKRDDAQLKALKATYDARRKAKAPTVQINAAKTAYEDRRDYWDAQIAPAKAALEPHDIAIRTRREQRDDLLAPYQDDLEVLKEAEAPLKETLDAAEEELKKARERVAKDGGAFKILASDKPDTWRALTDLAATAPFDFTTETERTYGAPKLTLRIHYPRAGRGRDDLIFEMGRNLAEMPTVRLPEQYVSEVIGQGAGQGESFEEESLHLTHIATAHDTRLRRNTVLSDPSITKLAVLQAATRAELRRLRQKLWIPELVVLDHENCPIGSWSAGDTITIRLFDVPHWGEVTVKHRVTSWQRTGTHKATLRLEPALG